MDNPNYVLPLRLFFSNLTHENWERFVSNETNWYRKDDAGNYPFCVNSSGAGHCPPDYTCLQGYGGNPNFAMSFNIFEWALLSVFRFKTQDYWENLYQQVLRSAGPWQMLLFVVVIFLGSFYLVNLFFVVVAMSYDELQRKTEEENLDEEQQRESIHNILPSPSYSRNNHQRFSPVRSLVR